MEVVITLPHFDPDTVMDSGQVFRWNKNSSGLYKVATGSFAFTFQRAIEGVEGLFSVSVDHYEDIQRVMEYFDAFTNYDEFDRVIREDGDYYTQQALKDVPGMRILQQDLWETIISFIVSQNNNIPNIKSSINKLTQSFGQVELYQSNSKICGTFWTFPTPGQLARASEDQLRLKTSIGYRAEYVINLARQVVEGTFSLDDLKAMDWEEADHYLQAVRGIGAKVANCIQLYGLHHLDAYPVDRWVERIIQQHYSYLSRSEYLDFVDSVYQGMQGYVQQLQFFYKRSK